MSESFDKLKAQNNEILKRMTRDWDEMTTSDKLQNLVLIIAELARLRRIERLAGELACQIREARILGVSGGPQKNDWEPIVELTRHLKAEIEKGI
jgi:hypothetical protein